jgi:hypothetical protein
MSDYNYVIVIIIASPPSSQSGLLLLLTHYLLHSNILYTQPLLTSWFLWREENRRKTPRSIGENQPQTQLT